MKKLAGFLVVAYLATSLGSMAWAGTIPNDLHWSIQYLVDSSQDDFGLPQLDIPRGARGLALDPTGQYLYVGFNNGYAGSGLVRRIDRLESDYIDAADVQLTGVRGKGITVDDTGRVYLAEGTSIKVFSVDLSTSLFEITGLTKSEGLAVTREGGQLVLYNSDRTDDSLTKWLLTESGAGLSQAVLDTSFGTNGSVAVPTDPRGVEVDGMGRVWVASLDNDTLYRVSADGATVDSTTVPTPLDIAFENNTALVTLYENRAISLLDADTFSPLGGDLTIPWGDLKLDPDGQSGQGALSGIAVLPGKAVYVVNEAGQTANEMSTYGRIDGSSGWVGGEYFTDIYRDDNEPILVGVIPEPSAAILLLCASIAFLATRSGRRHRSVGRS